MELALLQIFAEKQGSGEKKLAWLATHKSAGINFSCDPDIEVKGEEYALFSLKHFNINTLSMNNKSILLN